MAHEIPHTTNEANAVHLIQELGECIKPLTKFIMFGATPTYEGVTYDNVADFKNEFCDVIVRASVFLMGLEASS